jgi:hypothetical protein
VRGRCGMKGMRVDEKKPNNREYSGSNKGKQIKAAENSFKGMSQRH